MATIAQLAPRVLRKLGVLGAEETASSADYELAIDKLRAVHAWLKAERILQWTMNDIPDFAEEPYVMMAAFLTTDEFGKQPRPDWWQAGVNSVVAGINLRNVGPTQAEYY
jgi:hypothetical protein